MTTTTKKPTLVSPLVKFLYMNLTTARKNTFTGREEFSIRYLVDGTTTEGAAYKDAVAAVNTNKVVTESKTFDIPKGHFIVSAWSTYAPKVFDMEENLVTDEIHFTKGSTGTGIVETTVFKGAKGGGLNLSRVVITDLDLVETEYEGPQVTTGLKEQINKIKKG